MWCCIGKEKGARSGNKDAFEAVSSLFDAVHVHLWICLHVMDMNKSIQPAATNPLSTSLALLGFSNQLLYATLINCILYLKSQQMWDWVPYIEWTMSCQYKENSTQSVLSFSPPTPTFVLKVILCLVYLRQPQYTHHSIKEYWEQII